MAGVMDLIRKLRNPETKNVLKAIEELRVRGWLEDGSLKGVLLCHAHMQGADLYKSDLTEVDLHQASLQAADLTMANLSSAKLTRANLRGANFSRATLNEADFLKADLSEARNLTDEQLSKAKRLSHATMPDGNPYDGRFNLPADLKFAHWGRVDTDDPAAMAYFLGVSVESYERGQRMKVKARGVNPLTGSNPPHLSTMKVEVDQ